MSTSETPFSSKLFNLLGLAERVLLGATIAALLLKRFGMESESILSIALLALAGVYFLTAFRPPQALPEDSEKETRKLGLVDLLMTTVAPKVGWIGSAVAVIGIHFAYQGNKGSEQMLIMGGGALLIVILMLTYALINGNKTLMPLLMRALPLFLICVVLLSRSGWFAQ